MQTAIAHNGAAAATENMLGFTELKQWLHHRHPMIYIDRVLDYRPGSHLRSVTNVSGNMDAVAGHFPERAIFPGSHLIQAFSQSGIILYQMSTSKLQEHELTLIVSLECRLKKVVVPGDRVIMDLRVDRLIDNAFYFSGRATVDATPVASFRASLVRRDLADMGRQLW